MEELREKLKARGVMSWRRYSSRDWCKLNAIIVELEKNKLVTTKLKSKNAELRDRVTKVKQKQLQNDNSSNFSSSNFNSIAPMVTYHSKSLEDGVMDDFLDKAHKKSVSDEVRQRKQEENLQKQNLLSVDKRALHMKTSSIL